MDVMSVHSLEKHFFIIYVCMLSSDFHLSESVLGISGFNCLSVPVLKFEDYRIKERLLF